MATLLALAGCEVVSAPAVRPSTAVAPWSGGPAGGIAVRSPHYTVYTTVRDEAVVGRMVRVLEAAYAEYAALIPPTEPYDKPPAVYFFRTPAEFDAFTRRLTGRDAPVYLSVGPGGYAYGDRFVCWLSSENDLWPVVAHEGFHQYVARHLVQRLPPAVEEGLATTFESVTVTPQHVRIDRRHNARRATGLADAARAGALIPLDDLLRMHAGDIAGRPLVVREGFYGQCWAVARTLLERPEYAAGLRRMLADMRDGRAAVSVSNSADPTLYRPAAVRPLLQHYIAPDWERLGRDVRSVIARSRAGDEVGG